MPIKDQPTTLNGASVTVTAGATVLRPALYYSTPTQINAVLPSNAPIGPATVTVRTISFAPGEVGAWHYHPGPLFNVVTQGTVTVEDGCGGEKSYTVGQAFEEGGRVHRPKNIGGVPTFAYQTFVVPLGNPTTFNIPDNQRQCGPVREVSECMDNGWRNFTFPNAFNNQGECISFLESNH